MLKRIFRQAGWVSLGTAVGQGAVLLSTPLLARLYAPAEFGALALLMTTSNVAIAIGCLRYDIALPSSPDRDARGLLLVCLAASLLSTAVFTAAIAALRSFAEINASFASLTTIWIAASGCVCLAGAWQAANAFLLRSGKYASVGMLRASQGIAFSLLSPIAGVGLTAAYALSFIGGCLALVPLWKGGTLGNWLGLVKKYKDFPLLSLPGAVVDVVGYSFCIWTVVSIYGAAAGGELSQVQRLVGAPLMLVSMGLGQILLRQTAELQEDRLLVKRLVLQLLRVLGLLAFLVICVLFFVGKPAIDLVLGDQWSMSRLFIISVSIAVMVRACVSPLSAVLITYRRLGLALFWQVSYFISAALLFPLMAGVLSFEQFVVFYAVHEAVLYAVYLGLIVYSLKG